MDQNMLGAWLLMYIENNFPGGAAGFSRSGGMIFGDTDYDGTIVIYHPEMPVEFAEKVTNALEGKRNIVCTSDIELIKDILQRLSQLNKDEGDAPPVTKMEPERRLITDDDITNLRIAAEMGVDEFINNM